MVAVLGNQNRDFQFNIKYQPLYAMLLVVINHVTSRSVSDPTCNMLMVLDLIQLDGTGP